MNNFLKLNRILVLFISTGLIVLAFDIYAEHYQRLADNKIMWIPIIFGLIGGIVGIGVAVVFNKISYYVFQVSMLISMIVGSLGMYFHNKWRVPMILEFLSGKEFDFSAFATFTPILAPSAFIAMGMMGLIITFFEKWNESL